MDDPTDPHLAQMLAALRAILGDEYGPADLTTDLQELGAGRSRSRIRSALHQRPAPSWVRTWTHRVLAFAQLQGRRPATGPELPGVLEALDRLTDRTL